MERCSGLISYPSKADIKFIVVYILTFYLLTFGYNFTLQGGDVKFVTDRVALFAGIMFSVCITSILLTTLAISRFKQVQILAKILSLTIGWYILINNALKDMNTTLNSHGQYNFLMFCLLCFLGIFLFIIIQSCGFIRKKTSAWGFYGGLLVAFSLFLIFWLELARREKFNWNKGLSNEELQYEWPGCNIELKGTPWVGVIPQKTFNFYLSEDCPSVKKFSKFKDRVLKIDCDEEFAKIVEYPDFLKEHADEFIIEENGWERWKDITKAQEKRYTVKGKSEVNVTAEFFQVFCGNEENFYVQHVPKKEVLNRLTPSPSKMNLLIFQIDTLSRRHFMRRMHQTIKTLESLNSSSSYEVFQSLRLSTIGYNTEVNTKALYTGSQFRQSRGGRSLWSIFKEQNNAVLYLNGFCEDWTSRFLKTMPSGMDYFLFQPWCHPEYTPVNKTFSNFDGVNSMRRRCINGEKVHVRVFRYLMEFWKAHKDFGKMVLAPMQESHEASMDVISTLDPEMSDLLEWFKDSNELNNTVVVITSDHGSHMSLYYIFSQVGQLEHKLPGMFMIFPTWFLDKYPNIRKSIKSNEQPLTTHYDTHWALASLSQLPEFGGNPETPDKNQYTAVWDCRKNEKYIKDIFFFKSKKFYNMEALDDFNYLLQKVLLKINYCISLYSNPLPSVSPMSEKIKNRKKVKLENIPPCESNKCYEELNVYEVIKDKDSYFWLLDALVDVQLSSKELEFQNDLIEEYEGDLEVFKTFKSPGRGRYKLGKSLFHYSENKTCDDIGTEKWCPCS